jgi:hypothetical protein
MNQKTVKIITGKVKWSVSRWEEDGPDCYKIDGDRIDTILDYFDGKKVKITIEEVDEENND